MGTELSMFDREVVRILREAGVLKDYRARGRNGQIVVACSDGDQMKDLILHKWLAAIRGGYIFRPHMVCFHGGAMNVDPKCELYPGLSGIMLKHIQQAQGPSLKGITSVNLCIHTPCGAASLAGMNVLHQLWDQYGAAVEVGKMDPTDSIVPTLQVDYGPEGREGDDEAYRQAASEVQRLADELGVEILIPLKDGHRRRTYRVDLVAFAHFWESTGRDLWGDLFKVDPLVGFEPATSTGRFIAIA